MIRIRTTIDDKHRVYTLFHDGKWVTYVYVSDSHSFETFFHDSQSFETTSLFEAGGLHLTAAYALKNKLNK